jgi:hypothetical protein
MQPEDIAGGEDDKYEIGMVDKDQLAALEHLAQTPRGRQTFAAEFCLILKVFRRARADFK